MTTGDRLRIIADELTQLATTSDSDIASRDAQIALLQTGIAARDDSIAALQAQLDACCAKPLAGWWAGGNSEADVAALSAMCGGLKPTLVRSRGGEGEFDDPWLKASSLRMIELGYVPSLQVQPKVGKGSQRTGVGSDRILAGLYDPKITEGFAEFLQLPAGMRCPVEIVSEVDVQKGPVSPQPNWGSFDPTTSTCSVGTPAQYVELLRYFDAAARVAGVRDRCLFTVSMTRNKWDSMSASGFSRNVMVPLLAPLVADGVVDLIAADGYSGGSYNLRPPADIARGVRGAAADLGVRWAVMETGRVSDASSKAEWYRAWASELDDQCYGLVFNVVDEGGGDDFRPWVPDGSLPGFIDLMNAFD